ncbi:MAG: DUF3320 domain-containing protein [Prosthecochloris sp.]|nr:DUF3320 domain-containing protein [Prosthecochloris sp.]
MGRNINSILEESRKELLDLGLRNPLISYSQRAKQVKVVDELASEIYRILVLNGSVMSFDPTADEEEPGEEVSGAVDGGESLEQPDAPDPESMPAARHTDTILQTSLPSQKLQSRLLSIHNDARTYIEEQGVNILFLAVGFLHWYESPAAQEVRRAPLLLIPVELSRRNALARFELRYTGDDIGDNLSLLEKLRAEFSIELPSIEDREEFDIQEYFSAVTQSVKARQRWKVVPDDMVLGFFSFGKFLLYKDLDPSGWQQNGGGAGFEVLKSLLRDGFSEKESSLADETHIDDVLSPADVHQVKDADSTQVLAILDVNAGRNMVLQGPPGTGKSQTITNIIAESIGAGRKVLFVSEKMAALDVVKRRLDEVGLGDAVLELHSDKSKKKEVLKELERTLNQGRPVVKDPEDDINTLVRLRDHLNAYCDAVNTPIGKTRMTFVNALGRAIRNRPERSDEQSFDFAPMQEWNETEFRAARLQVDALSRHLEDAGAPMDNPFVSSRLTEFLPSQRLKLEQALDDALQSVSGVLENSVALAQEMGLREPEQCNDVAIICRAARRAMDAPHIEGIALSSGDWQKRCDDLQSLIDAGRALERAHQQYDEWLIDDAWSQDFIEMRQVFVAKGDKWWRLFSSEFREAKQRLQGLCRQPLPKKNVDILTMIDTVMDSQKYLKEFNDNEVLGECLFGAQWKKRDSDWDVLEKLTEWVVELYRSVGNGEVPEGILNFLSGSPKVDALSGKLQEVENALESHTKNTESVVDVLRLQFDNEGLFAEDYPLSRQLDYLAELRANIESLFHLIRFNQLESELKALGLDEVVRAARGWKREQGPLVKLFDFSWYNGLVEQAYVSFPSIKTFDRSHHTQMLEEFSRLDRLLFRHNQVRLASLHWKTLPDVNAGGQMQVIRQEINKKRRHLPIRKLMGKAGEAIQAIKPVFMMSPMSIATYIPPDSVSFDLVVFDEASQVKPVEAFGAIRRGKQSVVVGDSRQLPPTSFFDSIIDGGEDEEEERVGDMESILSLFLAKGAPERMLRWHYRSRHDSLIAVSNNEFYDNRLVVFPSPGGHETARGLRFHHLSDTVYERGKSRSNPAEARAVARAVMEHARTYPDLTLGVVAFSTAQRDAIEFQLEHLRRTDVRCEEFFSTSKREPFFVKNLENVQGDERDVIFISIGYGKTAEGYMTMSFGPLNRDGGERRLNVLISRARLAMDVFSNFTANDIDLNRSRARGVLALKNFLAYAQTGILEQPQSTGKECDSPFEEEVVKALVQHGIEVEPQVGTAGFFIDIGVKDPEQPGRYILGIECDGATYHSSRSARDRDRLRQDVLEGLGWRLHRIWSTDWYRNSQESLERVLAAIEHARQYVGSDTRQPLRNLQSAAPVISEIDREEVTPGECADRSGGSELYRCASLQIPLGGNEFRNLNPEYFVPFIVKVVETESPVHFTELTRRIAAGAGKKAGTRIQGVVESSLQYARQSGLVVVNGDFIWDPNMSAPVVRDRSALDSVSKKIDFVAPEEIQAAVLQEVRKSFSISLEDTVVSVGRALGFQRVTVQIKKRIEAVISGLVSEKELACDNAMLSVPKV